jgi:hypothetical protein
MLMASTRCALRECALVAGLSLFPFLAQLLSFESA